ncbi:MAG: hypothetical protein HKP62_06555 [Sulfurovum sp.]|nr:hypothetical protein [Sulfurovum sp.]
MLHYKLSDFTETYFSEGEGTTIYDISGNGNHGTVTNATMATFWGSTQDKYHYNIENGFRLSTLVKIPALTSGLSAADGNAITNPSGNWHNDAETLIEPNPNDAPELVALGLTSATQWDYGDDVSPATKLTDTNKNYDYKIEE